MLTTRATSLPPLVFRPASTPAAVKPAGWVTLIVRLLSLGCLTGTAAGTTSCPDRRHCVGGAVRVVDRHQHPVGVERRDGEHADLGLGEGLQQGGQHSGEREVERPLTANAVNGPACLAFFGTLLIAQTTLVSSAVAVIENSEDDSAQPGTSAPGPRRTTASFSGNCSSVKVVAHGRRDPTVESPVASGRPSARFMHCTAAPPVPLARLSTPRPRPSGRLLRRG